jgi:hypothetical protein
MIRSQGDWEADELRAKLDKVAQIGFDLVVRNMHFHEMAMADPFAAEAYVQEMGEKILKITGPPPGVTVIGGSDDA